MHAVHASMWNRKEVEVSSREVDARQIFSSARLSHSQGNFLTCLRSNELLLFTSCSASCVDYSAGSAAY